MELILGEIVSIYGGDASLLSWQKVFPPNFISVCVSPLKLEVGSGGT